MSLAPHKRINANNAKDKASCHGLRSVNTRASPQRSIIASTRRSGTAPMIKVEANQGMGSPQLGLKKRQSTTPHSDGTRTKNRIEAKLRRWKKSTCRAT